MIGQMDETAVKAIRVLSAEAIQRANSGHPGTPLGAAPMAYTLWKEHMKFNPKNPQFFNRDRFVLSAGHASMLQYSLLHLFGFDVNQQDLMNFRQLHSKTPGHPEYGHTAGVETSTGPLGQGIANAVGMAIAEAHLAAKFNREKYNVVDHYTYAFCGDGCMQEGIEYEAASLAGTLGLGKLIVLYDRNRITIEGGIETSFTEDVAARHEAQGWQVLEVKDGNDMEAVSAAILLAKRETQKPSLIIVQSEIGFGSPLAGTAACHGAPLGEDNVKKLKKALGWTEAPFEVPQDLKDYLAGIATEKAAAEDEWKKLLRGYKKAYPELAEEFDAWIKNKTPDFTGIKDLWKFDKPDATRNTGFTVLNKLAAAMPNLIGGSADLAPSNKSYMKDRTYLSKEDMSGSNIHFGIREHAMAAVVSGMYLHGGLRPYCSTFFVFTDYMKNAMRLAALMEIPVVYVLTHDSIGVGEDGATHQPVEQLIGLRSIPGLKVYRPADGRETAAAWISALSGKQPTAIVLSRQNLPQYRSSGEDALKGAYILADSAKETPDVILMASGSEVEVCMKAREALAAKEIDARVVSVPCMEVFDAQPAKYRESVLPAAVRARVAVEAASHYSWDKYVGLDGATVCIDSFGASAPPAQLFEIYGFTADNVADKAAKCYKKCLKQM